MLRSKPQAGQDWAGDDPARRRVEGEEVQVEGWGGPVLTGPEFNPGSRCVTLGQLFPLSEPQRPHL